MAVDIVSVQERALANDQRIASLKLDTLRRGIPSLPIERRLVTARSILTINGASTVLLGINDPDWLIEDSGLIALNADGRLPAINISLDGFDYRLVKARRSAWDTLEMTFEDEVIALMREHNRPLAASRGSMTRAEFIEMMVREIHRPIGFYSPQKGRRQPVARPSLPDVQPARGETGFDAAATFKVKGETADAEQMRQAATALGVADQEDASRQARLAMMVAAIGESSIRPVANAAGSGYEGVFQADPANIPRKDTAQQARSFLKGGKGFQAGGAIKAAHDHPEWSAGTIAYKVEGSRSNFASDQAAERFYQQWIDEARAIVDKWGSGNGAATDTVLRTKAYQFRRGTTKQREDSWEAGTRLADEVRWRLFAFAGRIWFVSDDYLITLPSVRTINGPFAPGLLEPPLYDLDNGKPIQEIRLRVSANRWSLRPSEVIGLDRMGPLTGRWILEEADQNLLDATDNDITLVKSLSAKKEPAPEVALAQKTQSAADVANHQAGVTGDAGGKWEYAPGVPQTLNTKMRSFLDRMVTFYDGTLVVTTTTNHSYYTVDGNVSDHNGGGAGDFGSVANQAKYGWPEGGFKIAIAAYRACGMTYQEARDAANRPSYTRVKCKEGTVQILWRVTGHLNHVHVGTGS